MAPADLSTLDAVKAAYGDLEEMTTAYIDLFATAREVNPVAKTARNSAYVEGLINNGGPAINTVRGILGNEAAETLFRRFLFGTEG